VLAAYQNQGSAQQVGSRLNLNPVLPLSNFLMAQTSKYIQNEKTKKAFVLIFYKLNNYERQ
jgi:hypothetical protein